MDEVCKNTLVPTSLIMRRCECFYCGAEDTGAVLVEYLFGMKVCDIHRQTAERDCRAYLHVQKLVRVKDAFKLPALKCFLDILAGHPRLAVQRTSGDIEEDWCFREGSHYDPAFLSKSAEGRWGVPMRCPRTNLNKTVPIINFLRDDITAKMVLPADWFTMIEKTLDCLEEGIYKAEAEAYETARNHDDSETIVETAGVSTVVYEGRMERVFLGLGQTHSRENGSDGIEKFEDPASL